MCDNQQLQLKPNRFYELTSGIELAFADVRCQYFIGQPPANQIGEIPTSEQDQFQVNTCICVHACIYMYMYMYIVCTHTCTYMYIYNVHLY